MGASPQRANDGAAVGLDRTRIAGLENASHIVLLGADTYHRQPIIDLRIRKAIRKGARVYVVTPGADAARPPGGGRDSLYAPGRPARWRGRCCRCVLSEGLTRGDYRRAARGELAALAAIADATPEQLAGDRGLRRSRRCGRWRARSRARRAR